MKYRGSTERIINEKAVVYQNLSSTYGVMCKGSIFVIIDVCFVCCCGIPTSDPHIMLLKPGAHYAILFGLYLPMQIGIRRTRTSDARL